MGDVTCLDPRGDRLDPAGIGTFPSGIAASHRWLGPSTVENQAFPRVHQAFDVVHQAFEVGNETCPLGTLRFHRLHEPPEVGVPGCYNPAP